MEALRGHTSGYCIPTFVVDAPGGGGKTPVMPQYVISQTPRKVILRNFEGVITTYTSPSLQQRVHCDVCEGKRKAAEITGVAGIARASSRSTSSPRSSSGRIATPTGRSRNNFMAALRGCGQHPRRAAQSSIGRIQCRAN